MTARTTRLVALTALTAALLGLFPVSVVAHAALDEPTPADGATVVGTPAEVAGTFTQDLEVEGSSIQVRDEAGTVIARGGVDPDDDRRMVISGLPELPPGSYEVRWTTLSAEDGELDRDTWAFTVTAAPTPSPTPEPTMVATASAEPTPSATPEPSPSGPPSPSASAGPTDPAGASDGDVILPIIAALAIVLVAAAVLLSRRGRPSDGV